MTNIEFRDGAREILNSGAGYIWGTSGEIWTAEKQAAATREMTVKYGAKWIGHHVYDCAGLVKALAAKAGIRLPGGTNSQWKGDYWTDKGVLSADMLTTLQPGDILYRYNSADGWYHAGIYEDDGMEIEAKGTQAGVVRGSAKGWTHWARLRGLTYTEKPKEAPLVVGEKAIVDVPNNGTVNVRKSASAKSAKLTTIREGEEVTVLYVTDDGWAHVRYQGEGYIMSKFLRGAGD